MASSIVKNVTGAEHDDPRWSNNTKWKPYSKNLYALKGIRNANLPTRKTVRTLGKGSYGRVNLESISTPFKPNTNGFIATKYFDGGTFDQESLQEIATLKYLKGFPNVAQYVGLAYDDKLSGKQLNFPAVIMAPAKTSLTDKELFSSWDKIFSTIVGVLNGVQVMHSLRIVHRDIKPGNTLMTKSGEPWITDFGSSKYISDLNLTPEDNWTGTYVYASPETLLKALLHRSSYTTTFEDLKAADAWSVGMSLIDMLTTEDTDPFIMPTVQEKDIENKSFDDLYNEDRTAYLLLVANRSVQSQGLFLRQIFRRMGLPSGGITHALYESYARTGKPRFVPYKSTSPKEYILSHLSQAIDTTNPEFQTICEVVDGLLDLCGF